MLITLSWYSDTFQEAGFLKRSFSQMVDEEKGTGPQPLVKRVWSPVIYEPRDPVPLAPSGCGSWAIVHEVKQGSDIWKNTLFPVELHGSVWKFSKYGALK